MSQLSKPSDGTTKPPVKRRKRTPCRCFIGVKDFILSFHQAPDDSGQITALANLLTQSSLEFICRDHLRHFAGTVLNMLTNMRTVKLRERLNWISAWKYQLIKIKEKNSSWFRGQSGTVWREIIPPPFVDSEFSFNSS